MFNDTSFNDTSFIDTSHKHGVLLRKSFRPARLPLLRFSKTAADSVYATGRRVLTARAIEPLSTAGATGIK
jgi:hypothetical protein